MPTKLPLRIRKATRTREAIIDAATGLFEKQGFIATTLNQIADAADVHKQTVLRYFGSKEDIALALRSATFGRFDEGLRSPERSTTVLEYWRQHIIRQARAMSRHPEQFRYSQFITSNDKIVGHLLRLERKYESALAEAFALEDGVDPVTDLHSKMLACMLVSGNYMVGNRAFKDGDGTRLEQVVLEVVDFAEQRFPSRGQAASPGPSAPRQRSRKTVR